MFDEEVKKISLSAYSLIISIITNLTLPVTILLIIMSNMVIIVKVIARLISVVVIGVEQTSAVMIALSAIVLSTMIIVILFSSLSFFLSLTFCLYYNLKSPVCQPLFIKKFCFFMYRPPGRSAANVCSFGSFLKAIA